MALSIIPLALCGRMIDWKRLGINVCLFFFAIAIFVGIAELALVVLKVNTKSNIRLVSDKGTTFVPQAYYRHTKEGFSEGYFNLHGFRDYERTHFKADGIFRILVLGDSYAEALQVPLSKTFSALLEQSLNERSEGIRFEVLNLGQSGFGTADAYMRFLNFGVHYSPDLVLLAFTTGNDVRNNSKLLNHETLAFYFNYDEKRDLVLDRSLFDEYKKNITYPKKMVTWLKRRSYLASLISERVFLLKQQYNERQFRAGLADAHQDNSQNKLDEFSDFNIYLSDLTPRWQEAFDITRSLLSKFKDSVEAHGAKFLLVTMSNAEQVHPIVQQRVEALYSLSFDFEQPDRLIEDFAKQNEIVFLKLLPEFREYHHRTGTYLHGFDSRGVGHWNEIGHQLAAEKILGFLIDEQQIPSFPHARDNQMPMKHSES